MHGSLRGRSRPPAVDDHIVREGSQYEIIGGKLSPVPPADEPHAASNATLAYLLHAHVAEGYLVAVDMLTRTSEESDFASDASVYPAARDPKTGGRQLEELAFEIVSEQAISVSTDKARELIRRGVRRVFCIAVKQRRFLEWSTELDAFGVVSLDGELADRCFTRPIPVAALLDATQADEAVVAALRARGALAAIETAARTEGHEEGRREGRKEGHEEGLRLAVRTAAELLGIELSPDRVARLESSSAAELTGIIDALRRERRWPQ